MIRRYSKKGLEKRKAERECLPEFFQKHIEIAKTKYCEECGSKLKGNASEIAHILPKNYFKSVMCNDLNVLYLCGLYSDNNCHYKLDNFPQEKVIEMKIFPRIKELYPKLRSVITEKLNYKLTERYDN